MGHWTLTIQGVGSHHTSEGGDANLLAADFIQQLREAGQEVYTALFMHKWGRDKLSGKPKMIVSDLWKEEEEEEGVEQAP